MRMHICYLTYFYLGRHRKTGYLSSAYRIRRSSAPASLGWMRFGSGFFRIGASTVR